MDEILYLLPILPFTIIYSKSLKLPRVQFTGNRMYDMIGAIVGIIFGVLIHGTAIIEEYIFNYIFMIMLPYIGNVYYSIILTSVLFVVAHYHKWKDSILYYKVVYIIMLFYLSLVYRSISYSRGSIYYSSICHITYNVIALILARIYGRYTKDDNVHYSNI